MNSIDSEFTIVWIALDTYFSLGQVIIAAEK
jgi:hypothetical protein